MLGQLQRVGKALMLPIAVLPAAGLFTSPRAAGYVEYPVYGSCRQRGV